MERSKLNQFIKSPNNSLIFLAIPVIASAIVETLYTVVNEIFVGRLGADALAALTFAWPFFFILTAISLGLNAGVSSKVSRFLGERNKKQAENAMIHGIFISFILAVIIALVSIPLLNSIFSLTGASGNVLQMSVDYMFYILLGIIFMFVSYVITSIFAAQGDTKTAMKIDVYSLILNIILAPLFIFFFHLGVKGAAIATTCSVFFAFVQSIYFLYNNSYLKPKPSSFKFSMPILKEIFYVGLPSTIAMLTVSFSAIFLNRAIASFGVAHVALLGIVSTLESISTLPVYGLSVGAMTLAGMFFGARKYNLLEQTSTYAIKIGVLVAFIVGFVLFLFPEMFIKIFTNDSLIISLGAPYIRIYVISLPFSAAGMIIGRILQGMGYGSPGLIISVVRVFVFSVPLAYLFVFSLGYGYISIAIALIIGALVSTVLGFLWLMKKIRDKVRDN